MTKHTLSNFLPSIAQRKERNVSDILRIPHSFVRFLLVVPTVYFRLPNASIEIPQSEMRSPRDYADW